MQIEARSISISNDLKKKNKKNMLLAVEFTEELLLPIYYGAFTKPTFVIVRWYLDEKSDAYPESLTILVYVECFFIDL